MFFQQLITGISIGGIYALLATAAGHGLFPDIQSAGLLQLVAR